MRAVDAATPRHRIQGPVTLAVVIGCVTATMLLGGALKAPCASGDWSDGRQYTLLCYSDIVPLLSTEQLGGGRLPFLDPCREVAGNNCDEYPVLTMYLIRLAAWVDASYGGFFLVNAVLLTVCALVAGAALYVLARGRALMFALAPTLLVYGFMNWDLLAVALATTAIVAFFLRRDVMAGSMLGLGAAAKLYPVLLVLPLVAERLRTREPDRAIGLAWSAAGAWALVNLPFALTSPKPWSTFFRFNAERPADWDSLWFIACRHADVTCISTKAVNAGSGIAFVVLAAALWRLKASRHPGFARWTLGFPFLVLFLLTSKVYSPQYSLWLLPWFAIALPDLRRFVAFEVADVAVFVTRFWFFGRLDGNFGTPQWLFEAAVLVRAAVLVWCLWGWLVREVEPLPIEHALARAAARARAAVSASRPQPA
jgi:uncharacterized membrane protein